MQTRLKDAVWTVTLIAGLLVAPILAKAAAPPTPQETAQIGADAYIYGYPLITMEMTRRVMTNVATPKGKYAPMGQFANLRSFPSPADREVTAPNADTLYSLAWLDVSTEPWIFSIPDAADRYYLMPMLDAWTDVFENPGKRTTGTGPQKYAITGPGWSGTLPEGVAEYKSPTAMVWILGRTYCTGTPEDYEKVHAFQDQLSLVPLSAYGKSYAPPVGRVDPGVDMKTPVREQVNRMNAASYFKLLADLMKENPPTAADAPMLARMAQVGIVPGEEFDLAKLDPAVAKILREAPKAAQQMMVAYFDQVAKPINGWRYSVNLGVYGTDYLLRAYTTSVGLGANRPQDAVYPLSDADSKRRPYIGSARYVLHFDKEQMPPVNGFWSLTMYDEKYFFVPNAIQRYSIGPRDQLKPNADGSVDLYLQKTSPGKEKDSNWLPAPAGRFVLIMRLYWPKEAVLDGSWRVPAVKKLD